MQTDTSCTKGHKELTCIHDDFLSSLHMWSIPHWASYWTMYVSSQMNQKNHQPAKRILDRHQGYVIGVVDMCLCTDYVVTLTFYQSNIRVQVQSRCKLTTTQYTNRHFIISMHERTQRTCFLAPIHDDFLSSLHMCIGTDQFLTEHPRLIEMNHRSAWYWTDIKAMSLELWTCICVLSIWSHWFFTKSLVCIAVRKK